MQGHDAELKKKSGENHFIEALRRSDYRGTVQYILIIFIRIIQNRGRVMDITKV